MDDIFYIHDSLQLRRRPSPLGQLPFWGPPASPRACRSPPLCRARHLLSKGRCRVRPRRASLRRRRIGAGQGRLPPSWPRTTVTTAFAKTQAEHEKNVQKHSGPRPRSILRTAPPPTSADRASLARPTARPERARLRARFADAQVDAYFASGPEHIRYHGLRLDDGERRMPGPAALVSGDDVVLFADSRYTNQATRQAPATRSRTADPRRAGTARGLLGRRVAVRRPSSARRPGTAWAAAPDVEPGPGLGRGGPGDRNRPARADRRGLRGR